MATMGSLEKFEQQWRLIYALIVAGKSADFADKASCKLSHNLVQAYGETTGIIGDATPFQMFKAIGPDKTMFAIKDAKTGNLHPGRPRKDSRIDRQ